MTLGELICSTVTPVVPVCVPDLYETGAGEAPADIYCTYNFFAAPDAVGDNTAFAARAAVMVHLYAPRQTSTTALRRKLWSALAAVEEFSLPTIENATDEDAQHYVYEFDAVGDWLEVVGDG